MEQATEQGNRIHTAYALNVLGSIARYDDDPRRALLLHTQALAIAHKIGEFWATLWALDGIATALWAQGRHQLAPRLLAAVERQQRETGHRRPPAERDLHVRDVAAVRARLSADQFAAEWRAGEAMSLEDAVAQALAAS